jgi:hypothetical protein
MANIALIWTFGGVLAAACFGRAVAMRAESRTELVWYTFGFIILAGTALLWASLESGAVVQQRIVLSILGAVAGALALVMAGEFIRPSATDAQPRPSSAASEILTPSQEQLLAVIVKYQGRFVVNKLVIGRDGRLVIDGQRDKGKDINLVAEWYGANDVSYQAKFGELMDSIPLDYLRHYPEMRWDSPFVVGVTDLGMAYLKNVGKPH